MKTLIVSVPGYHLASLNYRLSSKTILLLFLLLSQLLTQAQSGPWNLVSGQAYTSSNFALGLGTLAPTADFHLYKDYSSSAPAVPVPLMRVNVYNGFATSSLFELMSDGKLALGTSSPAQRLHVQGNAFISNRLGINVSQPQERLHIEGGHMLLENGDFKLQNGNLELSNASLNINGPAGKVFSVEAAGWLWARKAVVTAGPIPDFVFEPGYPLMALPELQQYLQKHKHLPGIPSAAEYKKAGGVDIGELQMKLLQKTEELTLYLLAQQKEINALKAELAQLKAMD